MDIHALPAYGRDYKSQQEVLQAWEDGKDFRDAATGRYLSNRDNVPGQVWIRYNRATRVIRVK